VSHDYAAQEQKKSDFYTVALQNLEYFAKPLPSKVEEHFRRIRLRGRQASQAMEPEYQSARASYRSESPVPGLGKSGMTRMEDAICATRASKDAITATPRRSPREGPSRTLDLARWGGGGGGSAGGDGRRRRTGGGTLSSAPLLLFAPARRSVGRLQVDDSWAYAVSEPTRLWMRRGYSCGPEEFMRPPPTGTTCGLSRARVMAG
jgi:hypothetical protein